MPELPEVETTRRGIAPFLCHQTIARVVVRQHKLRWRIADDLSEQVANSEILSVERRAKYLLLRLAHGTIIVHLGMSGSLRIWEHGSAPEPNKHDHVDLILQNGTLLRYHDPRRFGAWLWFAGTPETHALLSKLGPEPLSDELTAAYLQDAFKTRKIAVKTALMDNHIVVGVGNIYANESLFHSGILPTRSANSLSAEECRQLVHEIRAVLTRAIAAGGSTLRDFVGSDGQSGYFQQQYGVYGRDGEACRSCGSPIQKITQSQRSSFFCPHCQH